MDEQRGKAAQRDAAALGASTLRDPPPEQGLQLLEAFRAIDCPATRDRILRLVESLIGKTRSAGSA